MPASIKNPEGWTLRKLIQNTWTHMKSRYKYRERDVLKKITIQQVSVYDGKQPGEARTKYVIKTYSYPQYSPYFTRRDSRGRLRGRQRSYKHEYDITIQLDELSLDTTGIRLRTGSDAKWDFSDAGRSKKDARGRVIEGTNIRRGINGDHFFRLSAIRKEAGILFGRNFANGPPNKVNPQKIQFLTKHELRALEILINKGVIK